MDTAKLFKNGGSQAVRLPKDCQFPGTEVCIRRVGDIVMLIPKDKVREIFEQSFGAASEDFMRERDQGIAEERDWPWPSAT